MWHLHANTLLLASESPRRLDLLKQQGLDVQVLKLPALAIDEPVFAGESVVEYVTRTCHEKNQRAYLFLKNERPDLMNEPILTGDTTVAIDGEILGKPLHAQQAFDFLRRLNGQTHDVHSAVTIRYVDQIAHTQSHTKVTFGHIPESIFQHYIDSGEPMGKAGAYAIQGLAAAFVSRIEGSYTGVVGLPVYETMNLLQDMGLISSTDQCGALS